MKNKYDKRIASVLLNIGSCNVLVDVGTDHGKLAIFAKQKQIAKKVIATDIQEYVIKNLNEKLKKLNLVIETKISDGFQNLNDEDFDVVCILGIGGLNIINMLKNEKRIFNKYFFVPHQNTKELRKYLMNNNFEILKDFIVKYKNKHYFILEVIKSNLRFELTEKEIYYGKDSSKNPDFESYKKLKLKNLKEKIVNTNNIIYLNKLKNQISILEKI